MLVLGALPCIAGSKPGKAATRKAARREVSTIVKNEGNKKIKVKEGGRERIVSKMEAAAAQQWQKAMQGNVASAKLMFEQAAKADDAQSGAHTQLVIPRLDANAMRRIAERVLRNTEEAASDEPTSDD